jgi:hypothetical protein
MDNTQEVTPQKTLKLVRLSAVEKAAIVDEAAKTILFDPLAVILATGKLAPRAVAEDGSLLLSDQIGTDLESMAKVRAQEILAAQDALPPEPEVGFIEAKVGKDLVITPDYGADAAESRYDYLISTKGGKFTVTERCCTVHDGGLTTIANKDFGEFSSLKQAKEVAQDAAKSHLSEHAQDVLDVDDPNAKKPKKAPKVAPASAPCLCGCGNMANPGKKYLRGHDSRHHAELKRQAYAANPDRCLCGCGEPVKKGSRFIVGHDSRLHGVLRKVEKGELGADAIPEAATAILVACVKCGRPILPHPSGMGPICRDK